MLALRAAGLAEAVIREDAGRAADPVADAVDDLLAALILIEAEPQIVVQRAAGLRLTGGVDILNGARERIGEARR